MEAQHKPKHLLSPAKILALGFLLIILTGAGLLMLPFSAQAGVRISVLQAFFTATSAVCVTGLTVVDTVTHYSWFGEAVILSLIQLGGLGFMLFATSALVLAGRRITLRNRVLLHETMSMPGLSGTVRTTLRFMLIVFVVEITGSLLLALRFIPEHGFWRGSYYGVFHAISAFCNAGFDLFGSAGSLRQFQGDPYVLLTISGLIIIGGLGFAVLADIITNGFRFKKLNLHSKIVLLMTACLLLGGMLLFAMIEWDNPRTLAGMEAGASKKVMNAWFQSVSSRTAGFFSFPQAELSDASKLITTFLMFIGASPASTGGGIKTTTLFVLLALLRSVFYGKEDVNAFHKRLQIALIRTSLSIFLISLSLLAIGAVLLALFEAGKGMAVVDLVFEEVSALATVGLSAIGTDRLSQPSQMWLIVLMYAGRVGPLTMMLSLPRRLASAQGIRFPEEQIIVG